MTKFDSVQISHRKGKQASTYTTPRSFAMAGVFKATGVHPELEQEPPPRRRRLRAFPRPTPSARTCSSSSCGFRRRDSARRSYAVVVEVFEDIVPAAAKAFVLRATAQRRRTGGFVRYENTEIHRVVRGVRVDGGEQSVSGGRTGACPWSRPPPGGACRCAPHAAPFAVSLSAEGPTFTVAIGACPHLDGGSRWSGA